MFCDGSYLRLFTDKEARLPGDSTKADSVLVGVLGDLQVARFC